MNQFQIEALNNVCRTQEELADRWNSTARHYRLPQAGKFKMAVVTLLVVEEHGEYKWTAAVRVYKQKQNKWKRRHSWMKLEEANALKIALNELIGVGHQETDEQFDSRYALHINRILTLQEKEYILKPELLKALGITKPATTTQITTVDAARQVLQRRIKELEESNPKKELLP